MLEGVRTRSVEGLVFMVEVTERFFGNECPQLAAALAYYTIFSLPALVLLTITGLGFFVSAEEAERALIGTSGLFSQSIAEHLVVVIRQANQFASGGPWWSLVGSLLAIAFGATRGFVQLQIALNRAWSIHPSESQKAVWRFLIKRMVSFSMLLAIGPLVAFSTAISALSTRFESALEPLLPPLLGRVMNIGFSAAFSLTMMTAVLTVMYRYLPDAKIEWKQALPGGVFGGVGFEIIKSFMSIYLNHAELSDVYGQAGSLAVLLVWIYVGANLTFLGAQFAYVWSERQGSPIEPEDGAFRDDKAIEIEWAPRIGGWLGGSSSAKKGGAQ